MCSLGMRVMVVVIAPDDHRAVILVDTSVIFSTGM